MCDHKVTKYKNKITCLMVGKMVRRGGGSWRGEVSGVGSVIQGHSARQSGLRWRWLHSRKLWVLLAGCNMERNPKILIIFLNTYT